MGQAFEMRFFLHKSYLCFVSFSYFGVRVVFSFFLFPLFFCFFFFSSILLPFPRFNLARFQWIGIL